MLWINKDKLNCISATHINHKFNEQGEKSTQKSRNAIRTTRDDPKDQPYRETATIKI